MLAALMPGIVALAPVTIIGGYFLGCWGRPLVNLLSTCAALATQVPLVWLLTQWWGVLGAGIGTSMGYTAAGTVPIGFFARRSGLRWLDTIVPTRADARLLAPALMHRDYGLD